MNVRTKVRATPTWTPREENAETLRFQPMGTNPAFGKPHLKPRIPNRYSKMGPKRVADRACRELSNKP